MDESDAPSAMAAQEGMLATASSVARSKLNGLSQNGYGAGRLFLLCAEVCDFSAGMETPQHEPSGDE